MIISKPKMISTMLVKISKPSPLKPKAALKVELTHLLLHTNRQR
jgi:hypothetical protein